MPKMSTISRFTAPVSAVVKLFETTMSSVGNREYAQQINAFGLTTCRCAAARMRHVALLRVEPIDRRSLVAHARADEDIMPSDNRDRAFWEKKAGQYDRVTTGLFGRPLPRVLELTARGVSGAGDVLEVAARHGERAPHGVALAVRAAVVAHELVLGVDLGAPRGGHLGRAVWGIRVDGHDLVGQHWRLELSNSV